LRPPPVVHPGTGLPPDGDVPRPPSPDDLVDGSLRDANLEAVGVPDDPRRHVPAVGAAHHAEAVRIHELEPLEGFIDHGHHVLVVDRPPTRAALHGALDGPAPRLAVTR